MSAIEQALRQIDFQRERAFVRALPSSSQPPSPSTKIEANASTTSREVWSAPMFFLGILSTLVVVVALYSLWLHDLERRTSVETATKASQLSASVAVQPSQPSSASSTSAPVLSGGAVNSLQGLPAVGVFSAGAPWLRQAAQVWESGAWDNAARLWLDGLRNTAVSSQALQIADFQTLEQAQQLHQTWSRDWPVVILARVTPAGQRWTVLVLPAATEVGAALQHLSQMLGYAVTSTSVAQWVARADTSLSMSAGVPSSSTGVTTMTLPIRKELKLDKPAAAASRALPVASEAALAPLLALSEPPQLTRSSGMAPTDKARAVLATKAIDVDFSSVELLLTKGEFDKALSAAEQLENYVGSNWRTRYLTGAALSGLGRWDDAVKALVTARQKNPGHLRIALYLAVALQETGDHGGAFDTLVLAGASHPDVPDIWLNKGHSLQTLGRTEEAALAYRRFMDLSANRTDLNQQRNWVNKRLQKDR